MSSFAQAGCLGQQNICLNRSGTIVVRSWAAALSFAKSPHIVRRQSCKTRKQVSNDLTNLARERYDSHQNDIESTLNCYY